MRRAASNISTPMRNRSAPDFAISRARTISAISGGVSVFRTASISRAEEVASRFAGRLQLAAAHVQASPGSFRDLF